MLFPQLKKQMSCVLKIVMQVTQIFFVPKMEIIVIIGVIREFAGTWLFFFVQLCWCLLGASSMHMRVLFGSAEQTTKWNCSAQPATKRGELCLSLPLIMDYVNYSIHCKSNEDFRQIALQNVQRHAASYK